MTVAAWTPPDRPLGLCCEAEHWSATDSGGRTIAEAWVIVDAECALLYSLASSAPYARWLLHTAIVERLCASSCRLLITNSFDVPLMPPGQQHFQHLLGYTVARLRRPRLPHSRRAGWLVAVPTVAGTAAASVLIVSLLLGGALDLSAFEP